MRCLSSTTVKLHWICRSHLAGSLRANFVAYGSRRCYSSLLSAVDSLNIFERLPYYGTEFLQHNGTLYSPGVCIQPIWNRNYFQVTVCDFRMNILRIKSRESI